MLFWRGHRGDAAQPDAGVLGILIGRSSSLVSPILIAAVPKAQVGGPRYFPDQAGRKIVQVVPGSGDHTSYGPWGGIGIMAIWVAVVLVGGYVVLKRRDA